ncbi:type IV pilin protein [Dyella sp. ASV21]|uniref:type IV pilin protein n=1 Tax=Dyella sp. ASV21 TaxID=2795114 RepID=UPI0018EC4747|nr:type IV pilin protein [Dyella sp. ASV21]
MKNPTKHAAGFTLIELMISVAIIAILGALAITNYARYAQTSRRSDALSALSTDQGILERCYSQTFDYNKVTVSGSGCGSLSTSGNTSPNGFYTVALAMPGTSSPQTSYTLTATPATGSPQVKDTTCAKFVVSSASPHQAYDNTGATQTSTCWPQ